MLGDANLPLAQRLAWRATFPLVKTGILKGLGITPVRAAPVLQCPAEYPTESPSNPP
jgi:hypothetical protein